MSNSSPVFSAEFNDIDAYVEALEDAEFDMTISSLKSNHWSVRGIDLPNGVHVQKATEGGGTLALAATPATGCNIFLQRGCFMLVNSEELTPESAFIIPPDSDLFVCGNDAHRWLNIFVPEPVSRELSLTEDTRGREFRRPRLVHQGRRQTDQLWNFVNRLLSATTASPEISSSRRALSNLQKELVRLLRTCYGRRLEPRPAKRGRPIITDRLMVTRAVDAIMASSDNRLSMKDLVRITGVSERSLRAGFQRYLGFSPQQFMQLRTLNIARERLTRARPEDTSVTQIAADLGQWDVGRFASRYSQAFGELPSATLRSKP